jgi:predicted cupin superfamily sugar epimerase
VNTGIDLRDPDLSPDIIRAALGMAPHPEGGWYREMFRDAPADPAARGAATAILFLLAAGEQSAWHRVDALEIWLWQAGAALELRLECDVILQLGPNISAGETPQGVVPAYAWQAARSTGPWSLVSCIVAPAFSFAGFEMAPGGVIPAG